MSENMAQRHKLHWLPNALTISRIVLIPILVWAIIDIDLDRDIIPVALIIFIYCMLTDFLDGYIARKLKLVSDFGRMLDPIADKLLVASCLIAICVSMPNANWLLIPSLVIIGRDIFVSGIREHAANASVILSPTKLAKWKTAFEMLAILLFISSFIFQQNVTHQGIDITVIPNQWLNTGFKFTLWLAAILSAYTGFHYFRSAMRKP